jgi:serine/threonine protein kinase/WD40 repeat protein
VFVAGDLVDQYQVLRLLGRGGVGEVWLARDQVLGRKVALKVLRADVVGEDGRTLNDLLDEARANAAVVHPHVVTVYAIGSHRGAPYLALEYLDGATLRERIAARKPTVPEALRFARDIAAAVAAAHETGVLHLDLKPDNVLLASDGRLRVVDFGLARLGRRDAVDGEHAGITVAGTPAYMPPEIWRGEPPSEAADAWAFGVVLCELLTGQTPYAHESVRKLVVALYAPGETPLPPMPPDVHGDVRQLLSQLLQKDASRRPTLVDVERTLSDVLARERGASAHENPYRGLHPFRESDQARYFGRDDEIEAFVARLDHAPVLPIVGHSGAGKSSFVRAGVIPRLRERGAWIVVDMRPGPRPFAALARALRAARKRHSTDRDVYTPITATATSRSPSLSVGDVTESGSAHAARTVSAPSRPELTDPAKELAATLQQAPERLYLELAELARNTGSSVLLIVDQLEEATTLVDDEAVTTAFLRAIAGAADDVAEPVRVICTLRDDFLGRLAAVPSLRGAFAQVTVLRRPNLSMLVESIIAPLVPLGVGFDDGNLPLEMARAVEHEPAALPLLSFTCSALWERRDVEQRRLLRRVYVELGGVVGALAAHADAVFSGLSPAAQRVARLVLLGLVTEGRTRRRRSRRELVQQIGTEAATVIERFVEARLLTVERSARDDDSEVELAHEALVKAWVRLTRFLDEDRDQVAFLADVQQAADGWHRRGRRPSELWRGAALDDALARRKTLTLPEPASVTAFLDEALRERRRRSLQRNAAIGGIVAVLVVVAIALFFARARALEAADEAIRARAVAEREAAEAALVRGNVWPARAKIRTSLELDDSLTARAVWRALSSEALLFSTTLSAGAIAGAFGADGTVWVAGENDRVYAYAPRTFAARDTAALRGARSRVSALAVLGDRALVGERDAGGVALVRLDPNAPAGARVDAHDGGVVAIASIPSRSMFVTAGRDGRVRAFSADGVVGATLLQAQRPLVALAVRPDAAGVFAVDLDGMLFDVPIVPIVPAVPAVPGEGAPPLAPARALGAGVVAIAASAGPGVDALLVAFNDGRVQMLDAHYDVVGAVFVGNSGVARIAVDASGTRVAVGDRAGTVTLWARSASTAPTLRPIAWLDPPSTGFSGALAFDATGGLLLSTSRTGDVRVWRVDADVLARRAEPRANRMPVALSDDGERVAEAGDLVTVVRSATSGEALASFPTSAEQTALALDEHGAHVAVGIGDRAFVYAVDGGPVRTLALSSHTMTDATWLPDGSIVVATNAGTLDRFAPDASTATAHRALPQALTVVEPSHDGRLLVVGGQRGLAAIVDATSLDVVTTFPMADDVTVTGAGFDADDRRVALASSTRVAVFDVDGTLVRDVGGEHLVGACTGFDHRGRVLALRAAGAVAIDVDSGAEQPLSNVPPTGSCEMNGAGRLAMRLGDYVLPYDVGDDVPLWFARGVVDHGISTQNDDLRWPPAADRSVLAVAAADDHLCTAESGGTFVLRSRDGSRIRGRALDDAAPTVSASRRGCVWVNGGDVKHLRPAPDGSDGGAVDVVARDATSTASDGTLVVAIAPGSVRVVIDGDATVERALPLGGFLPEEFAVAAVADRRIAVVDPAGTVAVWSVDDGAPPTLAHVTPGDIAIVALGPAGLVAVGYNSESVAVVDTASDTMLFDEPVRGAPTVLDFAKRQGRDELQLGTNLGRVTRYDVGVFVEPWCTTLGDLWQRAPVAWEHGHLQPAPPPTDHACVR